MLEKTAIPESQARGLNVEQKHDGGWTGPIVMLVASLISYIDRQTLAVLSPTILADTRLTAADFSVVLRSFRFLIC